MNVNAVTREQLVRDFELEPATAEAIVRTRDELGGAFENWTQLRSRSGVDGSTVERLRERGLTFGPTTPPELPLDLPGAPPPVRDPEPEGMPDTVRPGVVDRGRGGVTAPDVGGNLPNSD